MDLLTFEMDARKGGRYRYESRAKPGQNLGPVAEVLRRNGGDSFLCHGEVLDIDAPRLVVWSWSANWHEHPQQPTTVRWELSRTGSGTHVRVTHTGLRHEPISRRDYGPGWQGVLALLKNCF